MSTGGIIGGAVGGIAGFFLSGNLYGAWVGFTLGFGLGMMIDPLKPDVQSPGQPGLGDFSVNTAEEGLALPDLLGTSKLNGNIVYYTGDRVVEITEEQETGGGGKGGGSSTQTVVTGYNYYLTWAMVLCLGPVDKLYTIYKNNDEVVWSGDLSRPISGGQETITLNGMGSATFYFGTNDQVANSSLTGLDPYNIPYRNQCWILFNDCCIGNYNRAPTMSFVVGKFPTASFNANETINIYDYNPAHAIYYICNTMVNMPSVYLDSTTFSGAADTLKNEERGVSILFNSYQTSESYLESLLAHIKGIIRFTADGKFGLKLIRDDTDVDDMTTITASDMLTENYDFDRKSWIDTVNDIDLQYAQRIFREPTCPDSTEGYDDSDVPNGAMQPGVTYTLYINNPQSQQYFGLDCEPDFLDDGGGGGTFDNLRRNPDGTWSFDYTTSTDLCNPEYDCPTIGGTAYDCCTCSGAGAISWSAGNPQTIAVSGSAYITVSGGVGPFLWTVTGVNGYFNPTYTQTTYTGSIGAATIYTKAGSCGALKINVTDTLCSTTTSGVIRTAVGSWVQRAELIDTSGASRSFMTPVSDVNCNVSAWDSYSGPSASFEYIYDDNRIYCPMDAEYTIPTPLSTAGCAAYTAGVDWKVYVFGSFPTGPSYWVYPGPMPIILDTYGVKCSFWCPQGPYPWDCDKAATGVWYPCFDTPKGEFYKWEC